MVMLSILWAGASDLTESGPQGWIEAGTEAIRSMGPGWYFLAMTVVPLPLAWFTVPAGEAFADELTLGGVVAAALAAVAGQLVLSYWAGRRGLRPLAERWARNCGREIPRVGGMGAWRVILMVRLTPGPPMILGSALLAAGEAPFWQYLLISWLVAVPWVVGGVVTGKGILGGDWGLVASGVGALVAAGLATRYLRRKGKGGA